MSASWQSWRTREGLFRGTAAVLVVWYALIVVGLPIPTAPRSLVERFPCEHGHCGCTSAEHCWRSCCCHSLSERLAWAKREGVTPPAFVRAEITKVELARVPSCGAPLTALQHAGCCQESETSSKADPGVQKADTGPHAANVVVAWRAMACRGTGLDWTMAVPAVGVVPCAAPAPMLQVEWFRPATFSSPEELHYAPPAPPPRSVI